jgi:hypothetical protein
MNGCPDAGPGMAFDSKGRLQIAWFAGSEKELMAKDFIMLAQTIKQEHSVNLFQYIYFQSNGYHIPLNTWTTDAYDNSWIVFVNSEGLKKKLKNYEICLSTHMSP